MKRVRLKARQIVVFMDFNIRRKYIMGYKWSILLLVVFIPPYILMFKGQVVDWHIWIYSSMWVIAITISMQLEEYLGRE